MKEKIERFFLKGRHLLVAAWMNVAFMSYVVIDMILECSWQNALIGFLVFLPWVLLFFEMYKNHKMQIKAGDVIALLGKVNDKMIAVVERYYERYGELPEEEETEKKQEIKE